ncbi:unnamed protein product, partial [Nesidiocoris tenuis]
MATLFFARLGFWLSINLLPPGEKLYSARRSRDTSRAQTWFEFLESTFFLVA